MSSFSTSSVTSGSGIDVDAVVSQLIEVERAPERTWQAQQKRLQSEATALNNLSSRLSALDSSMDSLKDVLGAFSKTLVTSSDDSLVTATGDSNAAAGTHAVVVSNLATKASYYSNALASSSTIISSGSLSIKVGTATAVAVTIDSNSNTYDKLATKINSMKLGVTATVINDANGARLAITGNSTGTANDVVLSDVTGFTFTQSSSAGNAKLTVDGIPVESANNTVTNVIAGVTLQLQNTSSGKAISVEVAPDTGRVAQGVQDFVSSYNSIISYINNQFSYDPTNQTIGVLSGNPSTRILQEQLLGVISYSTKNNGSLSSLYSLGITMGNDGTLTVDPAKLNSLLESNYSGVKGFFQGSNSNGFANSFGTKLTDLTSSTGPITVDLQGNSSEQAAISRHIDDFEVHIEFRRQQLLDQYSRVDALLRQFPLTQSQVSSQLNALNSSK